MSMLRVEGLGKAYRVYKRPFDSLKEVFLRKDYSEVFWALRDVSFEIGTGQSLGIIGDNGAGKTTLLKMLAGALAPTTGRVERSGRVAALLTLGGGFHPDLSGIDNIRIGCAVLGMSPAETDELIPEVVKFSELGDFIHRPVRTYSSGMNLRLGFSVATAVTPDVLVIDEHLAVGDQHFRLKSKRRIMELREGGCTIVLCSHDLGSVNETCDHALWLERGHPKKYDESHVITETYLNTVRVRDADAPAGPRQRPSLNCLKQISLGGDVVGNEVRSGGTLKLRVVVSLTEAAILEGATVALQIMRDDGLRYYRTSTKADGLGKSLYAIGAGEYGVTFVIDALPLMAGSYSFLVALQDFSSPHTYDWIDGAARFVVKHEGPDGGLIRIQHRWEQP